MADSAYINAAVLRELPADLRVIGPPPLKAALNALPGPRVPGQRGRPPLKGERLPTPGEAFAAGGLGETRRVEMPGGQVKRLRLRVLGRVPWYSACKTRRVKVVLVRDESGAWPDTALLRTDPSMKAEGVVAGYARRWSIETSQADYTSRRRWGGAWRIAYHRREGVARAGRVVPATPGRLRRRNRMSDTTRRPAPPRARSRRRPR